MTGGWAFNVRLFSALEKPDWQDKVKARCKDYVGGVHFVGAQWDANKTRHQPPDEFDEDVNYRSVIIKTFQ